jgi:hypothetical protein
LLGRQSTSAMATVISRPSMSGPLPAFYNIDLTTQPAGNRLSYTVTLLMNLSFDL